MNPEFAPAHLWLGRTHQELGYYDEAVEQFRWVEERAPNWCVPVAARGFVLGMAGNKQAAQLVLAELKDRASHSFVTPYSVALVHAGLGEESAALDLLAVAFDQRSNWLVWLRIDPRWKYLRSHERFRDLVARMRFPASGHTTISA